MSILTVKSATMEETNPVQLQNFNSGETIFVFIHLRRKPVFCVSENEFHLHKVYM